MSVYKGNLIVQKSVDLLRARSSLLLDKHEDKYISEVADILQTPFSVEVSLTDEYVEDDDVVKNLINNGLEQLIHLHGFADFSQGAMEKLQQCAAAQLNKFAFQYRISESRRKENIPTAFKSSVQHVLCGNYISDPGSLQRYMHSKVYPSCIEIVKWWTKFIDSPHELRSEMLKETNEVDDSDAESEPAVEEAPKRGRKRKTESKATAFNLNIAASNERKIKEQPAVALAREEAATSPKKQRDEIPMDTTEAAADSAAGVQTKPDEEIAQSDCDIPAAEAVKPTPRRRGRPRKK